MRDVLLVPVPRLVRELLGVAVGDPLPVPAPTPGLSLAAPLEDCSTVSVDLGVPVPATPALPEPEALAPSEALTLRLALPGEAVGALEAAALPVSVPGKVEGEEETQSVELGVGVPTLSLLPEVEAELFSVGVGVFEPWPCAAVVLPLVLGVEGCVEAADPDTTAVAVSQVWEALSVPVVQARGVEEADTQADAAPLGVAVPSGDALPPKAPPPAVSEAVADVEKLAAALALPLALRWEEGLGVLGAEEVGEGVSEVVMDCSWEGVLGGEGVPVGEGEVDCVVKVLPVAVGLPPAEKVCEVHTLMLGVVVGHAGAVCVGVPEAVPVRVALELWHSEERVEAVGSAVEEVLCDTVAEAQGVGTPPVLLAVLPALSEGLPVSVLLLLPCVVGLMDTVAGGLLLALPPVALAERAVPCGVSVPQADTLARGVELEAMPRDALTDCEALRVGKRDGVDGGEGLAEAHVVTDAVEQGEGVGVLAPLAVPCGGETVGRVPLAVVRALSVELPGEDVGGALPAAVALLTLLAVPSAPVPLSTEEDVAWPARDAVTLSDMVKDEVEVGEAGAVRESLTVAAPGVPVKGGVVLRVGGRVLLATGVRVPGLEGEGPAGVGVAVRAGEGESATEGVEHCVHAAVAVRAVL